jgi:hypothetical protein
VVVVVSSPSITSMAEDTDWPDELRLPAFHELSPDSQRRALEASEEEARITAEYDAACEAALDGQEFIPPSAPVSGAAPAQSGPARPRPRTDNKWAENDEVKLIELFCEAEQHFQKKMVNVKGKNKLGLLHERIVNGLNEYHERELKDDRIFTRKQVGDKLRQLKNKVKGIFTRYTSGKWGLCGCVASWQ